MVIIVAWMKSYRHFYEQLDIFVFQILSKGMLSLMWKIKIVDWSLSVLTLHVCDLIHRTIYALWKSSEDLFVFLEIDISKSVLFSSVDVKDLSI